MREFIEELLFKTNLIKRFKPFTNLIVKYEIQLKQFFFFSLK